ncbi:MAG: Fe-S cluster assembly protein SufD [Acidobacteria bacterium]|nr:Fe-S cluster assembly protein SufD [Acidobacteriota bacterium]
MIEVKENQDVYFAHFAALEKKLAAGGASWLQRIRRAAIDRFAELGFPTTRLEAWKFTNVTAIANTRFEPARYELNAAIEEKLKASPYFDLGCSRLAFLNGTYSPELSSLEGLPKGVRVKSLAAALAGGDASLESHLARYANPQDHAFVALNMALMEDGAFLEIPKGLVLEHPIYVLFITTVGDQPTVSHPRNLILIGREAQVTLIEGHLGLSDGVYFTNAVTEVAVGENAVVNYCKLQHESKRAYHVATLQVRQERSSNLTTFSIAFGGLLARQDVTTVLDGEGAECLLNGLYVVNGRQHIDNYTTIDHAKPHANSREVYKGVLDGKSAGVFHGRIIVRKDAQKTDAKQSNRNLLLSDDATINTKPQLEIYADDVKCTHGATIGQIDGEAIFYLRSRGIAREEARSMLTYAFASEIISQIKFEPMRARLTDVLFALLGRDPGGKEA